MPKQLYVAFTGEGATDETFLSIIIRRTLEAISLRDGGTFDLMDVIWLGSSKGSITLDRAALNLPPDLESRANTKELLKEAIRMANIGQTRGRGFQLSAVVESLANEIDLAQLKRLPGYQRFVQETEEVLREIGYLRR